MSGYTGPGGMTILPHRAAAKLDLRLVPDMTAADTLAKLKAHLAKRGFGDLEVKMTGGYDPNSTSPDSRLIRAQAKVYERAGIKPILWPRSGGSWPGYVFTGEPLKLPAGHFGLGHGHARARAGRVLPHRIERPEAVRARRHGALVRRLSLRARVTSSRGDGHTTMT